ncbi:MAG: hypothetical protein JKX84_01440 [Flavobacteriales bacterium]|nr:hypothetical protein [Flavobacteriales bacterium]
MACIDNGWVLLDTLPIYLYKPWVIQLIKQLPKHSSNKKGSVDSGMSEIVVKEKAPNSRTKTEPLTSTEELPFFMKTLLLL